jgi:hypothetical protein
MIFPLMAFERLDLCTGRQDGDVTWPTAHVANDAYRTILVEHGLSRWIDSDFLVALCADPRIILPRMHAVHVGKSHHDQIGHDHPFVCEPLITGE